MATVNLSGVTKLDLYGSAAPTLGTHNVGDRVWNPAPVAGGNIGWVCTVAGTPGTWRAFGTIATPATAMTLNTQTASYVLVLSDANDNVIVVMNVATANLVTVPPNSAVAFPVGAQVEILQLGVGQTTILAGSGVSVFGTSTLKLSEQYARCVLLKTGTNTWVVAGEMALT